MINNIFKPHNCNKYQSVDLISYSVPNILYDKSRIPNIICYRKFFLRNKTSLSNEHVIDPKMINGLNTDYKQSDRSNKVCSFLSVCMRTIKRMLALALKVYTQRMFIISEAHQAIVVVNAKVFICSRRWWCLGRHNSCLLSGEYNLSTRKKEME